MGIGIPRPLGPKKSQLSLGSQGYLYQPARSERYVLDDANDVMGAVLRISLVQEHSWVWHLEFTKLTLVLAAIEGSQQTSPKRFERQTALHPGVQTLDTYQRQLCSRLRRAPRCGLGANGPNVDLPNYPVTFFSVDLIRSAPGKW